MKTESTPQNTIPIHITKSKTLKEKPSEDNLGFGKHFTDHMFLAKYHNDKGWYSAEITPVKNLELHPAASVLHYGQALFEGMKAFRQKDGSVSLFRTQFNWERMCIGAERLCLQAPPLELFQDAIKALVKIDQDWVPQTRGCSLYIRPTLIGVEPFLGVRPSQEYLFFVLLSPAGNYFGDKVSPVKIWVEDEFLRAAPGGLGHTKAAANYAGSLKAAQKAKQNGFSQVLWLDVTRKFVEEVGTMNVFFVIDDRVITPELDGTILGGGVRDAAIQLLKHKGYKVSEQKVSIEELRHAQQTGRLKEAFGTGTAAIISPIGELRAREWDIAFTQDFENSLASELYNDLIEIQSGQSDDIFSWMEPLK
ncbi:MAG: branched-chain amino acid aminotransferase [Bdellovibrionaceae bacterium]|nr:branched-chain amino acid aminotransferase [Pseudobdellovibrionaceae bacterium]